MRRPYTCAFAALFLLLIAAGCKGDLDKIQETLEAYTKAVVVHRAPYHAYVHLDPEDKAHLSVEAYVTSFEERETAFPPGTQVTVGDASISGDRAETLVKITPPEDDAETRKYVLRRDGTKWRVWLGLSEIDAMREKLAEAKRLADEGALEQAKEKLEEVATANFKASRPAIIENEVLALRQSMTSKERFARLDARFKEAMKGDVETMKKAVEELSKEVGPDDEAFYPRLEELRAELNKRTRELAIANFAIEDVSARSFRDAWGTFKEVRFEAKNNTGRPLSKLAVRLELKNEDEPDPVASIVWQLVEEGSTLPADETVEVKREVNKAPDDWNAKEVTVMVEDLEFADDGGTDDAG